MAGRIQEAIMKKIDLLIKGLIVIAKGTCGTQELVITVFYLLNLLFH